jgi:hypothetical protein
MEGIIGSEKFRARAAISAKERDAYKACTSIKMPYMKRIRSSPFGLSGWRRKKLRYYDCLSDDATSFLRNMTHSMTWVRKITHNTSTISPMRL